MKDLDARLHQAAKNTHQPRELSADFTARVVSEVRAHPTPRKESLFMKFWKKPLVATLAAVLVVGAIGGTTYAATDGFTKPFNLNNIFGYTETPTKNGRIIQVKTSDCSSVALKADTGDSDRTLYFRVKDNAPISTETALQYVQGYCESLRQPSLQELIARLQKVDPANTAAVLVEAGGSVTKANDTQFTTTSTTRNDVLNESNTTTETFSRFAPNAIYENGNGTAIKRSDIVTGRDARVIVRSSDNEAANTVVYVMQSSAEETLYLKNAFDENSEYRQNVTRVEPCDSDPSGYCAVADAPKPQQSTPKRTQKPKQTTQPSQQPPRRAAPSAQQQAVDTVKRAFTMYANQPSAANKERFIKSYTTAGLGTQLRRSVPYDPILCVQQGQFTISLGKPRPSGNTLSVTVHPMGKNGFPNAGPIDVTYNMTQERISSITCNL